MKMLLLIAALFVWAASAEAQLIVDIDKASLTWTWTQGTGSAADGFRLKCGTTTGNYTKVTEVAIPTARSVGVRSVITGSGVWFCAGVAYNKYGESGLTNEVNFDAGAAPSGSMVLTPPK